MNNILKLSVDPGTTTPLSVDHARLHRFFTPTQLRGIGDRILPSLVEIDVSDPDHTQVWLTVRRSEDHVRVPLDVFVSAETPQVDALYWAKEMGDRIIAQQDEDQIDKLLVAEAVRWMSHFQWDASRVIRMIERWQNDITANKDLQHAIADLIITSIA